MTGKELIEQVRKSLSRGEKTPATDRAVASFLGLSMPGFSNWKVREEITTRQMAGLLASVAKASQARLFRHGPAHRRIFPLLPRTGRKRRKLPDFRSGQGR